TPADIGYADRSVEVTIHRLTQIGDFGGGDPYLAQVAVERDVRRTDEREVLFERDHEDHASIGVLQQIRLRAFKQTVHHNVRPLHEPYGMRTRQTDSLPHRLHPAARRIHQRARMHFEPAAIEIDALRIPPIELRAGTLQLSTGQHLGAAGCRVERVQYDQAAVIHPAVRVAESIHEVGFEGQTRRIRDQADLSRGRQALATAQVIVKEEPEADLP